MDNGDSQGQPYRLRPSQRLLESSVRKLQLDSETSGKMSTLLKKIANLGINLQCASLGFVSYVGHKGRMLLLSERILVPYVQGPGFWPQVILMKLFKI